MRGGHLAILRRGFGATKESEVAVSDIVPVSGAQFEETLASARPDVLREMIRELARRLLPADGQRGRLTPAAAARPGGAWRPCRRRYPRTPHSRLPKPAKPWVSTVGRN